MTMMLPWPVNATPSPFISLLCPTQKKGLKSDCQSNRNCPVGLVIVIVKSEIIIQGGPKTTVFFYPRGTCGEKKGLRIAF